MQLKYPVAIATSATSPLEKVHFLPSVFKQLLSSGATFFTDSFQSWPSEKSSTLKNS
jgi:hypothetical protein